MTAPPAEARGISHRDRILTAANHPDHNIDFDAVPVGLQSLDRWFCWKWEWNTKKWSKIPIQTNGRNASSTGSETWTDFSSAVEAAKRNNWGLGFALGDGIAGIDLDDCRDPVTGELLAWAAQILRDIKSYAEVSPSETGIKILLMGTLPEPFNKKHKHPSGYGEVEIYQSGRFFTITGKRAPGTPHDIAERSEALSDLYNTVSGWKPAKPAAAVRQTHPQYASPSDDVTTALSALAVLDPGMDYEGWLSVGMCLHSVDSSEAMLAEFDSWSRGSDKYVAGDCEAKWRSFGGDGVTIRTLCHRADQTGQQWRPARAQAGSTKQYDLPSVEGNTLGETEAKRIPNLKILTAGDLIRDFAQLRRMLIDGLLRDGEVMNVIAPPKLGKSWLVLSLVLAVACGIEWLGRFATRRGKVLLVDNELHPETLANRLPRVAMAMGLSPKDYGENVSVICLRGRLMDLKQLAFELMQIEPGSYDLIVFDAWYRLLPAGTDENANGDVTQLYNLLESVADRIGSAFTCIHHTSKGNQSEKNITDVGSGAGAQARAADTHMVMRPHEVDGAIVVGASVRSWAPLEPFVMRFEFPVFTIDEHLNPNDLKTARPRKSASGLNDKPRPEDVKLAREHAAREKVLEVYRLFPDGETQNVLRTACGLSGEKFTTANDSLVQSGLVERFPSKKNKQPVFMYRLTEGGQVGQVGQNNTQSGQSRGVGQVPPPLGGTVRPTTPPLEDDIPKLSDYPDMDGDF